MSGFEVSNGRLVFTYGDRQVATTGGTLLQFLTEEQEFTASVSFPNASLGEIYAWSYQAAYQTGPYYQIGITAQSVCGAYSQEWDHTQVLGAAPAGADFFVGRAVLSRTASPTQTWIGQTIFPVVPEGVGIPVGTNGSMLVEAALGLSRALTIDVEGSNLVAILQHSVGPVAGNFRQWGIMPPSYPGSPGTNNGGENTGTPALPVYWRDDSPYRKTGVWQTDSTLRANATLVAAGRTRQGGSEAASYPGSPDYSSTYALTVRGRFGRRS
jgi:hypothetical protein